MGVIQAVKRLTGTMLPTNMAGDRGRLLVVTYHRVLPEGHPEVGCEQAGMWVTPETLAMHCSVLSRHFSIVDLGEWIGKRVEGSPLPRNACAFTFDDGWRDNLEFAHPVLMHHGVPATIFAVTAYCSSRHQFWPNRIGRLLASGQLSHCPPDLTEEAGIWMDGVKRIVGAASTPIGAMDLVVAWSKTEYSDLEMTRIMDSVSPLSATSPTDTLKWSDLRALINSGLWRVGSHTQHHVRLGSSATKELIESEIRGAVTDLKSNLGVDQPLFCFPNGDVSADALAIARQWHPGAVTTDSGWNDLNSPLHSLKRISLHNDISSNAGSLLYAVRRWLR